MPSKLPNLQIASNSSHAVELSGGLSRLRFAPELEREFLAAHLARMRLRVRAWQSLGLGIAGFFSVSKVAQVGWWHPVSLVHVGLMVPLALLLTWAAWSPRYGQVYLPIARIATPLIAAMSAAFAVRGASLGHAEELAVLSLQMMCVFLLSGLLFRSALLAGFTMWAAYVAAAVFFQLPATTLIEFCLFLAIVAAVAAGVCWSMEHASRKSFLEGGLIAELVACDGLTGLKNRRAFDEHFARLWSQCMRDRRRLAIVMFDVDYFKPFNDGKGHQAGDDALRQVAQCARELARRPLDMAARYGGDEFVLLLYDLAPEHVMDIAERLRRAVADLRIEHGESAVAPVVTVTVGAGVVSPAIGRSPSGALQLADEALYSAKQAGRNCVRMLGSEEYDFLETGVFDTSDLKRRS